MTTSCPTVIANHDAFRQSVPYTGPQQCETSKNRGILGFFSLPKRRNFKGSKPVPPIRALSYGPSHPSARDCAGLSATKSRSGPASHESEGLSAIPHDSRAASPKQANIAPHTRCPHTQAIPSLSRIATSASFVRLIQVSANERGQRLWTSTIAADTSTRCSG